MQKLTPTRGAQFIVGLVFGAVGVLELFRQEYLNAAIWLVLAPALMLSVTESREEWHNRPVWLKGLVIGLTLVGLCLLIVQIVLDFRS